MGFDRRFELGLAWRALVVLGAFALLVRAVGTPGLGAARVVAFGLALWALASLWHHIRRTNFEVARFVESVRFEDYTQRFSTASGGGFDVLGDALDSAMRALSGRRTGDAEEARFLSAVVDDAPVALLSIADDGAVALLNKAARRQFGRHPPTQVEDFAAYGAEFAAAIALPPGGRRVTRLMLDGLAQRALLATARVERLGSGLTIASVLPAQSELGAVELAAQADLVRVLTHEIMNSLTPVTSLARSTAEIVAAAARGDPALDDARLAAETLANRADGILRFVESYRDFSRSLEVHARRFAVAGWAAEIARLAAADPVNGAVALAVAVEPADLLMEGDPDLLAQVVFNLIRNAAIATAGQAERRVTLSVRAAPGGHAIIAVADNGPGIPPERRDDVFLPFYTTRSGGSGVGLSLARRVALAHGGSIAATEAEGGGAAIRMLV